MRKLWGDQCYLTELIQAMQGAKDKKRSEGREEEGHVKLEEGQQVELQQDQVEREHEEERKEKEMAMARVSEVQAELQTMKKNDLLDPLDAAMNGNSRGLESLAQRAPENLNRVDEVRVTPGVRSHRSCCREAGHHCFWLRSTTTLK